MAARLTAYLVALIVAVTFIAGLIVGAQRGNDGPVDLIVVNGSVYTADGDSTMAEAVAVQGNKILLVGSNREVQRLRRPQTLVVDAKGGAVLPGFNESTTDFLGTGLSLQHVDLTGADSLIAVESTIKAWAAANPEREWVLGHGWVPEQFGDADPNRMLLDALVPDRPAYFVSADGERAWVNTAALKRAKITRRTPNPVNGTIVREAGSGEPTGVLVDEAMSLVGRVVPPPTQADRLTGLRAAIEDAHRRGVTSVQDLGTERDDLEIYDAMRRDGSLDIRVYAALRGSVRMSPADLDELDELRSKYDDDPLFKTGAVTLVADDEGRDELRAIVAELDSRGWQVIIQAIGERAVQMARDAVEYASGRTEAPERGRRHRVEPVEEFDEPSFARGARATDGVQLAISERRPLTTAVDQVTRDAAWDSFDEHRKGSLERDMLADLIILRDDIFSPTAPGRMDVDIAVTIFNGRVVYTRPSESNE